MVRYFEDMWRYTPAPAIKVEGGIKAASSRGAFASQWWGKRWIQALERSPSGARLKRGRTYARKGQVMNLNIEIGAVEAVVQGSRVRPYKVDMRWPVFSDEVWTKIAAAMAMKPLMAAQLLQGHMPEDIESLFAGAGMQLLPPRLGEIHTRCSCPDSADPCKHIAAVCYLLAEALDQDPVIMFKLRGIERDAFLARLRLDAGDEPNVPNAATGAEPVAEQRKALLPNKEQPPKEAPLPVEPQQFWQAQEIESIPSGMAHLPATNARWPKRLGSLPLWRSDRPFIKTMESHYCGASRHAEELGERLKCED